MHEMTLSERVKKIKGDQQEINRFVEEYKPFIASCAEKATGRFVHFGEDDELSIALMAFVEAVNSFDGTKGNFLSFSQNVIRRRLIDYYRKEKKHSGVISINEYQDADSDEPFDLTEGEAVERYSIEEISELRRLELIELKKELLEWDISFMELVECSPKHSKTRKLSMEMVQFMLSRPDLIDHLKTKKQLPIVDIQKNTGIPRKNIERTRKYLIAVIIILTGDYQFVREYVDWGC